MTKEYNEGYKEGQEAFKKQLTSVVKRMTLATLEAIERKKAEKAKVEEELRVLKLDLEDLKEGKIDKIEERQENSKVAKSVSVIEPHIFHGPYPTPNNIEFVELSTSTFPTMTSGTYTLNSGSTFYL